ncbi:MAG: hypothetical protein WCB11_22250 [Terriglobales bacterium]|jgi:hypothetical protein
MPRSLSILLLLIILSVIAAPQAATPTEPPAAVTFTLDFPASQPEHYSIRVQSDGATHYSSSGRLSPDSEDTDSFDLDFALLPETRQKIFALAAKADYFQKAVDSRHKSLAFTGKKTLAYKDAQRSGETTYNYSNNSGVQELTALMQNLSTTLEFGHRLQYDLHYQKLALNEELQRMDDLARSHELMELTAIRPILDQLIADPGVINVTRARAQRLLERAAH